MKIVESPLEIQVKDMYFKLNAFRGDISLYLKLEGLNPAGSIKIKPAINMIEDLEERGLIKPGRSRIIESSSGNLGVALSLVCKVKGYDFTCVTDPNIAPLCLNFIHLYGGRIIQVTERDENGGFLNTRIKLIRKMVEADSDCVWTNQYANQANPDAHFRHTAREIHRDFPHLECLFIGAGTTGTLVGCADYFSTNVRKPKIIAVDAAGSVTFGHSPAKRFIPGLGTSRKPEVFTDKHVDDVYMIKEEDTILMAQEILERYCLFIGGSTATVLCGVAKYLRSHRVQGCIVAISPDFGDKYMDTIFNPEWISERFPAFDPEINERELAGVGKWEERT